jgi:hypothetical protein
MLEVGSRSGMVALLPSFLRQSKLATAGMHIVRIQLLTDRHDP